MVIQQPSGIIKMTNVSNVRMRRGKKRYEIVCYQNKVQDWRRGVEKDLDEVLQVHQVFVNSSKGEVASILELESAFGTSDLDKVIMEILDNGELQVGGKERQQQQTELHNTVLQQISSKCVNPKTKRPYPPTIIEKALAELGFQYTTKPAKGQALEAIKLLVEKQLIPIARARMRVRVSDESEQAKTYAAKVKEIVEVGTEDWDGTWELEGTIDPGDFRMLDELVAGESRGIGDVEVLAVDY